MRLKLPKATTYSAGVVSAGSGLAVDANGVLSATGAGYTVTRQQFGSINFEFAGAVAVVSGGQRWYPPVDVTLGNVYFTLGTAPSSGTVTVQAKVNGVASGDPVVCAQGDSKSAVVALTGALTTTDYISFDITGGTTGADLFVSLNFEHTSDFPIASNVTVGMVQVGNGLSVTSGGILSAEATALIPATNTVLGGVIVGSGLAVTPDGHLSVNPITLPIANATRLGGVKAGTGVSIAYDGTISATGGSGGGGTGTGYQVLTDANYFNAIVNVHSYDHYSYLSIGTGGDFADIYAFAEYVNTVSVQSLNSLVGYFKDPGIVTLTRDLHFTNSQTFGNIFLMGAGLDGTAANGPYNGTITYNITAISAVEAIDATNFNVTVTVTDSTGLYVGGILAIYRDNTSTLANPSLLLGASKITAITGNSVTLDYKAAIGINTADLVPLSGLTINAKFNRTVIKSSVDQVMLRTTAIYIEGMVGNPYLDGGFSALSFDECSVNLVSSNATLVLSSDLHFLNSSISNTLGTVETWGDIFLNGSNCNIYVSGGSYNGKSSHYVSRVNDGQIVEVISGGRAFFTDLSTIAESNLFHVDQRGCLDLYSPSIGSLVAYDTAIAHSSNISHLSAPYTLEVFVA